jgi:two-component system chemotaxis response regulator CheY
MANPPRVLVVDDSKSCRNLIKMALTQLNYTIAGEAADGQEAVDVFRSEKPDMVLLDINMPKMTGEQALPEIMAINPEAFVVMMTSVSDLTTVEKCLENGASNYIRKDTPIEEIKNMIKETWEG